jgi:hypothetical protein
VLLIFVDQEVIARHGAPVGIESQMQMFDIDEILMDIVVGIEVDPRFLSFRR